MPYINTVTNVHRDGAKEIAIKDKLGAALAALGKSENWLMLNFTYDAPMYFAGKADAPMAIAEVSLYGKASAQAYDEMTARVTAILAEELAIAPDRIYVKYDEVQYWGWNGNNF